MKVWKNKGLYEKLATILFPILLFLYPLRHICYGAEWWDTGYNYGNFVFIDKMDSMWIFSTYLANVIGNLMTKMPFGKYMLGMNFYTGMVVSVLALSGYFFFTKKVKMPAIIAFAGEIIGIGLCWCPTALLYNYLTYLLMLLGVIFLYLALTEEKKKLFIVAGICLGINIFVRFPNMAEMALIVAVWAYAMIQKKPFKQVAIQTGLCLVGYLAGALGVLGYICVRYGFTTYIDAIQRLFGMTSDATDYTIRSMVEYQLRNYWQNMIWLGYILPFVLLGVIGFMILPKKMIKIKQVGFVAGMLCVFYWLMNQNMFNMKYSTKLSVFQWAIFLLTFSILIGIYTIFNKSTSNEDKLLCGLAIIIAVITPLGSNNHLYSSMNNLFFCAPVILWMLWKTFKKLVAVKEIQIGEKKLHLYSYPIKATLAMIIGMLLVQSIGFGFGYVFSESDGGENLHTKIENSDILKGMYTDDFRAEQLESLTVFTKENQLTGKEVILYGEIPSLSYYLEMPFAISAWPDLRSYTYEVMESDLENVKKQVQAGGQLPAILFEASYGNFFVGGREVLEEKQLEESKIIKIEEDKKFKLLMEFALEYNYELKFSNEKFTLFMVNDK